MQILMPRVCPSHPHVSVSQGHPLLSQVTDGVVDVIACHRSTDVTTNRGFAFIEYETHKAAAMARRALIAGNNGDTLSCPVFILASSSPLYQRRFSVSSSLCPAEGGRTQNTSSHLPSDLLICAFGGETYIY